MPSVEPLWAVVNSKFVPDREAAVSVHDRGFRYGDGVFDTLRVYDGRPLLLDRHVSRLLADVAAVGINPPTTPLQLGNLIRALIDRNGCCHALVRTTVTRGESTHWIPGDASPTLVIVEHVFSGYPTDCYESGIAVVILSDAAFRPAARTLPVKSISLSTHVQALREAVSRGARDAILCSESGSVAEATTSNVFCRLRGRLCTPPVSEGILPGITREVILELAARGGLPVAETTFTPAELLAADEMFLTNSGMEVLPVTSVDGRPLGSGRPGPWTRILLRQYREFVADVLGSTAPR